MQAWLITLLLVLPSAAEVCNPADVHGVYGFQLSGTTTISSRPQPVVSVGRLVFDTDHSVSGISSTRPWHVEQPIPLLM